MSKHVAIDKPPQLLVEAGWRFRVGRHFERGYGYQALGLAKTAKLTSRKSNLAIVGEDLLKPDC